MRRMTTSRRFLLLAVPFVLAACASAMTPSAEIRPPAAAVGRITDIEVQHGYVVAEFPNGRMNVSMDKRALNYYRIGDEIRIDSYGRPLGPH